MTPEERFPIAWTATVALAVKVMGRREAAKFIRAHAAALEAEQERADERARAAGKVVQLASLMVKA